jgi:prevent-host-death family protein
MSTKARREGSTPPSAPRTSEISSSRAQDKLGEILTRVAGGERIVITRYGQAQAVMVPVGDFREMVGQGEPDLQELEREFDERFAQMQTAAHSRGVDALFALNGEQLGAAARRAVST